MVSVGVPEMLDTATVSVLAPSRNINDDVVAMPVALATVTEVAEAATAAVVVVSVATTATPT
jgi:hypothetical protein